MISLWKIGNTYNSPDHKEFLMDDESDISNLPNLGDCASGSLAFIPDNRIVYALKPNGTWVKIS